MEHVRGRQSGPGAVRGVSGAGLCALHRSGGASEAGSDRQRDRKGRLQHL